MLTVPANKINDHNRMIDMVNKLELSKSTVFYTLSSTEPIRYKFNQRKVGIPRAPLKLVTLLVDSFATTLGKSYESGNNKNNISLLSFLSVRNIRVYLRAIVAFCFVTIVR